jgi:hypothetical protein
VSYASQRMSETAAANRKLVLVTPGKELGAPWIA